MPVDWKLTSGIELGDLGKRRIDVADGDRRRATAEAILNDLHN